MRNAYLDKINGLAGKKAIIVLTSGSGAGVKRCFTNIRTALENKGASGVWDLNIKDKKSADKDFVAACLEKILNGMAL